MKIKNNHKEADACFQNVSINTEQLDNCLSKSSKLFLQISNEFLIKIH